MVPNWGRSNSQGIQNRPILKPKCHKNSKLGTFWIPHDDQLMGLKAQEDVGSVKLGEWVGWVGFQREYCIVYKTGLGKLSVTFLLGRICFFFSEAHYVVCVSAFVLIFLVFSILFKVSTVIKKQDRYNIYVYIVIHIHNYSR